MLLYLPYFLIGRHLNSLDNTGKVTSLVGKKDLILGERIEEAIRKNESLESLTADSVRRDAAKPYQGIPSKNTMSSKFSNQKKTSKAVGKVAQRISRKAVESKLGSTLVATKTKKPVTLSKAKSSGSQPVSRKSVGSKAGRTSVATKTKRPVTLSKAKSLGRDNKVVVASRESGLGKTEAAKLRVVGFRGCSTSSKKETLRHG